MSQSLPPIRIAIVGGGAAALFLVKHLLATGRNDFEIDVFESGDRVGAGFPYSSKAAGPEHVTNVSGNEIPELPQSLGDWFQQLGSSTLEEFNLHPDFYSDYKVVPRILFGDYLETQFYLLTEQALSMGIPVAVHFNTRIVDVIDQPKTNTEVTVDHRKQKMEFDKVIFCTGHSWPQKKKKEPSGLFHSPYPPESFRRRYNHPVAILGSSLTAIDAIRTLARANGVFKSTGKHQVSYHPNKNTPNFKMVMYTRDGLLPALRFHLKDPHLDSPTALSKEEILQLIVEHEGFLPLDVMFEQNFKMGLKKADPSFYKSIKDLSLEAFVELMLTEREQKDPFQLMKEEYVEAAQSIQQHRSVYWKELLGALSFSMNYPAKHLSAEDMLRLKKVLQPLISVVIAYAPQPSCEEVMALHAAGVLDLVRVDENAKQSINSKGEIIYSYMQENGKHSTIVYKVFIDCTGQPQFEAKDFPFPSIKRSGRISQAFIRFKNNEEAREQKRSGNKNIVLKDDHFFLKVPGLAITDTFNLIDKDEVPNRRLYLLAVPFIAGFNPDYSGLDFCEEAAKKVVSDIF